MTPGMFSVVIGVGSLVGGVVAGALYGISVPALAIYVLMVGAVAFTLIKKATSSLAA